MLSYRDTDFPWVSSEHPGLSGGYPLFACVRLWDRGVTDGVVVTGAVGAIDDARVGRCYRVIEVKSCVRAKATYVQSFVCFVYNNSVVMYLFVLNKSLLMCCIICFSLCVFVLIIQRLFLSFFFCRKAKMEQGRSVEGFPPPSPLPPLPCHSFFFGVVCSSILTSIAVGVFVGCCCFCCCSRDGNAVRRGWWAS